jgi:hypothetical protein
MGSGFIFDWKLLFNIENGYFCFSTSVFKAILFEVHGNSMADPFLKKSGFVVCLIETLSTLGTYSSFLSY